MYSRYTLGSFAFYIQALHGSKVLITGSMDCDVTRLVISRARHPNASVFLIPCSFSLWRRHTSHQRVLTRLRSYSSRSHLSHSKHRCSRLYFSNVEYFTCLLALFCATLLPLESLEARQRLLTLFLMAAILPIKQTFDRHVTQLVGILPFSDRSN